MSQGEGSEKSPEKVSRIIWMAPRYKNVENVFKKRKQSIMRHWHKAQMRRNTEIGSEDAIQFQLPQLYPYPQLKLMTNFYSFGAKAAHKMLVKFTIGVQKNCKRVSSDAKRWTWL